MYFLAKNDSLAPRDKVFVKTLFTRGYSAAQIKEVIEQHFDYSVDLNTLYRVKQSVSLLNTDPKVVNETGLFIAELEKVIKFSTLDEVERTRRLRLSIDSRIQEQVENNGKLKLSELGAVSRSLFEREQLLVGRPTSITQSYKGMSDDELLKQLKELDVISVDSGKKEITGQTNASGIEPPQTGGENSILETSS